MNTSRPLFKSQPFNIRPRCDHCSRTTWPLFDLVTDPRPESCGSRSLWQGVRWEALWSVLTPCTSDGKPQHKAVGDWPRGLQEVHQQSGTQISPAGRTTRLPKSGGTLLCSGAVCVMADFCPSVPHCKRGGPGFRSVGRAVSCKTRAGDASVGWRRSPPPLRIHHRTVADTARGTCEPGTVSVLLSSVLSDRICPNLQDGGKMPFTAWWTAARSKERDGLAPLPANLRCSHNCVHFHASCCRRQGALPCACISAA